jgi:hypothetical protein
MLNLTAKRHLTTFRITALTLSLKKIITTKLRHITDIIK